MNVASVTPRHVWPSQHPSASLQISPSEVQGGGGAGNGGLIVGGNDAGGGRGGKGSGGGLGFGGGGCATTMSGGVPVPLDVTAPPNESGTASSNESLGCEVKKNRSSTSADADMSANLLQPTLNPRLAETLSSVVSVVSVVSLTSSWRFLTVPNKGGRSLFFQPSKVSVCIKDLFCFRVLSFRFRFLLNAGASEKTKPLTILNGT